MVPTCPWAGDGPALRVGTFWILDSCIGSQESGLSIANLGFIVLLLAANLVARGNFQCFSVERCWGPLFGVARIEHREVLGTAGM